MKVINEFSGDYNFLSNFYILDNYIYYNGYYFKSTEHAYQASKIDPSLPNEAYNILISKFTNDTKLTSGQAKRAGKKCIIRPDWDEVKDSTMYEINYLKYTSNPDLSKRLIDTNNAELIEGNTWKDTYWGVYKGKGLNKLGKILMRIRDEIRT